MSGNYRRAGFLACALAAGLTTGAQALDLEAVVPAQALAALSLGLVTSVQFDSREPALLPDNEPLRAALRARIDELKPAFLVESLYVYQKPAGGAARKTRWSAAEQTAVLNAMSALSTLSGIEYYSASRKKMRTFYETSAVIAAPDDKTAVADPVFSSPPPESTTLYARQKDLSFGDNVYRYVYTAGRDEIIFTQQNLTAMSYGIIPVLAEKNLVSVIGVLDCGDALLFYTASMARALSVPGLKKKVSASFINRAESLIKWFTLRAGEAYGN